MLMRMGEAAPDALVARGGDQTLARHPARRDAMLHQAARGCMQEVARRALSCAVCTTLLQQGGADMTLPASRRARVAHALHVKWD